MPLSLNKTKGVYIYSTQYIFSPTDKKRDMDRQCWSQCSSDVSHFGMAETPLRVSVVCGVMPMRHVVRMTSAAGFSSGDIQLRQIVSRM